MKLGDKTSTWGWVKDQRILFSAADSCFLIFWESCRKGLWLLCLYRLPCQVPSLAFACVWQCSYVPKHLSKHIRGSRCRMVPTPLLFGWMQGYPERIWLIRDFYRGSSRLLNAVTLSAWVEGKLLERWVANSSLNSTRKKWHSGLLAVFLTLQRAKYFQEVSKLFHPHAAKHFRTTPELQRRHSLGAWGFFFHSFVTKEKTMQPEYALSFCITQVSPRTASFSRRHLLPFLMYKTFLLSLHCALRGQISSPL